MNDFVQFALAMWDAVKAAMIGLNPVPAIIISLLIGMAQGGRGWTLLKAVAAVVPAMVVTALWPLAYNDAPIWPDLRQLEVEIQVAVLVVLSYVIIRLIGLIKATLSLGTRAAKKA